MADKKEYIERGAVLDQMMFEMVGTGVQGRAMDVIRYAPAAEVVEIVRCKDCKENPNYIRAKGMVWCRKFRTYVEKTDFCSYGERKDKDDG